MKKLLLAATALLGIAATASAAFPEPDSWYQIKNALYPQSPGAAHDIRDNSYLGYYPETQWYIIPSDCANNSNLYKSLTTNNWLVLSDPYQDHENVTDAQKNGQLWRFEYNAEKDGYMLINKAHPNGAVSAVVHTINAGAPTAYQNSSRWLYVADRKATPDDVCYFSLSDLATLAGGESECRLNIIFDENHPTTIDGKTVGTVMDIAAGPQQFQVFRTSGGNNGSLWRCYEDAEPVEVTYTFTDGDDDTFAVKCTVFAGHNASDYIPSLALFTASNKVNEANDVISSTNNAFTVNGTWDIDFNKVYRAKFRQTTDGNANNKAASRYWLYSNNILYTREGSIDTEDEFTAGRLWYFEKAGITDDGSLKVKIHNIYAGADKALSLTTTSGNAGTFVDKKDASVFAVQSNGKVSDAGCAVGSFVLKHTGADNAYLHDYSSRISVWNDGSAKTDAGSVISLYSLTDSDWANDSWHFGSIDIAFDPEKKASAEEQPTPEKLHKLFELNAHDMGALHYYSLTAVPFAETDGNISVPGYVTSANAKALYDVLTSPNSTDTEITAAIAALPSNTATGLAFTEGVPYAIKSTEFGARGQMQVYSANGQTWISSTKGTNEAVNTNDVRFLFSFVNVGGKTYMYYAADSDNCFANAFGPKGTANAYNQTDYSWQIAEVPTEVNIVAYAGSVVHAVSITGGKLTNGRTPGMMMINNDTRTVPVLLGFNNNASDGTGLLFEYVPTPEGYPTVAEMRAKVEAALSAVETAAANHTYTEKADEYDYTVNDFTHEHKAIICSSEQSHDYRHYLLNNGNRYGVNTEHAYQLINAEGKYWYVNNGTPTQESADKEGFEVAKTYWQVEEAPAEESESGLDAQALGETAYQFVHVLTNGEGADNSTVTLAINGNTAHTLGDDTVGKVKIGDEYYTLKAAASAANATTPTSISEISVEGGAQGAVYDLQGRRLAAPAKGINIIGGRKVLVK